MLTRNSYQPVSVLATLKVNLNSINVSINVQYTISLFFGHTEPEGVGLAQHSHLKVRSLTNIG